MNESLRTANLLGALSLAITDRLLVELKEHSRQNDTSASALNVISFAEGCTNGQLCAALQLSHSATVRLVDKLSEAGFVEVRQGLDKRSVAIFLTDAGRDRTRSVVQARNHALGDLVELLAPQQRAQLDGIAEILLEKMTQARADAMHICRLCDEQACPQDRCPVHQKYCSMPG
ncbi:MarR family winged helix-turn-helix transcriptional regulator [Duganella sp. BuS-21]|uniref:MarR family winged helix-turn-helix transcriptional regulator n=1 Tax=Duganella sp. BuS-21 TaxID=2943848 RepID=UPI0035A58E45